MNLPSDEANRRLALDCWKGAGLASLTGVQTIGERPGPGDNTLVKVVRLPLSIADIAVKERLPGSCHPEYSRLKVLDVQREDKLDHAVLTITYGPEAG